MTNLTGAWALENLAAIEELRLAIVQMSLEAGAAGDAVAEDGDLVGAAPSVDVARQRVARASARLRECPPPPDPESAQHLAALLDALHDFDVAEHFDERTDAWGRAMDHSVAFGQAFAIANGQKPPGDPAASMRHP